MQKRKKEEQVINLGPSFTNYPIYKKEPEHSLVKKIKLKVEWKDLLEETQTEDRLSFMGDFDFPELDKLEFSLRRSGKYNDEEIKEIVAGLKTLPEYRD